MSTWTAGGSGRHPVAVCGPCRRGAAGSHLPPLRRLQDRGLPANSPLLDRVATDRCMDQAACRTPRTVRAAMGRDLRAIELRDTSKDRPRHGRGGSDRLDLRRSHFRATITPSHFATWQAHPSGVSESSRAGTRPRSAWRGKESSVPGPHTLVPGAATPRARWTAVRDGPHEREGRHQGKRHGRNGPATPDRVVPRRGEGPGEVRTATADAIRIRLCHRRRLREDGQAAAAAAGSPAATREHGIAHRCSIATSGVPGLRRGTLSRRRCGPRSRHERGPRLAAGRLAGVPCGRQQALPQVRIDPGQPDDLVVLGEG